MAKLNEPPVVGESVEALKRRFMRQNRELAKSNSALNIRIANLEADRSQLLSENITLREENNQLRQEVEKDAHKRALQNVGSVKEKLTAKVAELTDLMHLLDKAHTERPQPTPAPKTVRRRSFQRSPTQQRNWRNTLYGPEVTGLAPIVEGKYFPRRTLEYGTRQVMNGLMANKGSADEIQQKLPDLGNVTESPELGPPPVAHFDDGDPIKQDPIRMGLREDPLPTGAEAEDKEIAHGLGFANLETRRKRRGSSLTRDAKTAEDQAALKETQTSETRDSIAGQPLRAGAKRKLSLRDEDESAAQRNLPDSDGFAFSRKGTSTARASRDENKVVNIEAAKVTENGSLDRRRETSATRFNRKALGEKSVNTDPIVSPAKQKTSGPLKAKDLDKEAAPPKFKARDRSSEKSSVESAVRKQPQSKITVDTSTEHKESALNTPAPPEPDLFSPLDSQPSSANPSITRDTPPPSDLLSQSNEAGRPSRRQRATVNYAQPNLRDKMRRPGKELVDAVSATNASTTTAATKSATTASRSRTDSTPSLIKQEANDDDADDADAREWKKLPVDKPHKPVEPSSPLGGKSATSLTADLPSSVLTDRRRRSSVSQQQRASSSAEDSNVAPASSSLSSVGSSGVAQSTIAALVAGSQKRLSRAREAAEAQRRLSGSGTGSGEKNALDIYEFEGSSSPPQPIRAEEGRKDSASGRLSKSVTGGGAGGSSRLSRRHSSMSDIRTGSRPAEREREREEVKAGLGRSNSAAAGLSTGKSDGRNASSKADGGGGTDEEDDRKGKRVVTLGRAERAMSRRKSMMV